MALARGQWKHSGSQPSTYRYWITDAELEKLDLVIDALHRLGEALEESAGDTMRHFELTQLAVPNWATWLRLLKEQLRLQLAVRDYLYAFASHASQQEIARLAAVVRDAAGVVREIGDISSHVD